MTSRPVANKDLEGQLDYGNSGDKSDHNGQSGDGGGYDGPHKPDDPKKSEGPEKALIPASLRPLVWTSMTTFVICFLAVFGGRAAWEAYNAHLGTMWQRPTCHSFNLLFHTNMVMGVMYGLCALLCIVPGLDKMFYGLFWDPSTFPEMKTNGNLFLRQCGIMLLGLAVAQCIAPSNTGVGICALCVCCAVSWNFILGCFFGHYRGVRTFKMKFPNPGFEMRMADGFLFGGFVFIALLAVGLDRTNFFNKAWKNDGQHEQTWLFYINNVTGIMYMCLGIMLSLPGYNQWFWSFHFKNPPFADRTAIDFLNRNMGLMVMGLSAASLIAPGNPGVGVTTFWVHLLLIVPFVMTLMGMHGEVNNKFLWVGWLVNTILFTVLFAVALKRLDDCDPSDSTCGDWSKWTDQPWHTGSHTNNWIQCTNSLPVPTPAP